MSDTQLRPLPPIEQVRPGIWSIPVPLPVTSLRYVLVYAFETDAGPYLFDAGWDTEEAFHALNAGLEQIGTRIEDVQGVVATHIHPDHYGLCRRIRETSGAWIALHPADAAIIPDRFEHPEVMQTQIAAILRRSGVPEEEIPAMTTEYLPGRPATTNVIRPDILIEDKDHPEIPGWDLLALWTPGHSPGHCCYYEDRYKLMLTGDHVLPRITPSIPLQPHSGDNPLGDFFSSLERLGEFDVDEALPAHQHRIDDLQARIAEIRLHHERRLAEVVEVLRPAAATAFEVAQHMGWSRPWEKITGRPRRAAILEALSHLRLLEVRHVVREHVGDLSRFSLVD